MSPLYKITKNEHTSQLKLPRTLIQTRSMIFDKKTIPVTLCGNLLRFHDTDKNFEIRGDLSKMITNKNYNVELAIFLDKRLIYGFAPEGYFDERDFRQKK